MIFSIHKILKSRISAFQHFLSIKFIGQSNNFISITWAPRCIHPYCFFLSKELVRTKNGNKKNHGSILKKLTFLLNFDGKCCIPCTQNIDEKGTDEATTNLVETWYFSVTAHEIHHPLPSQFYWNKEKLLRRDW